MAIKATQPEQMERELIPAGMHLARCYSMIEIGTIEVDYQGDIKNQHKVQLTWEFPTELRVFDKSKGEQPMVMSKTYTLSMHEKATLRLHLESWRGKGFSEDEAKGFDITKLLGVSCMINVTHNVSTKGNKYANISAITPLAKGMTMQDQVNKNFVLSYDDFEFEKYNSLPQWLREKMAESEEFRKISDAVHGQEEEKKQIQDPKEEPPF